MWLVRQLLVSLLLLLCYQWSWPLIRPDFNIGCRPFTTCATRYRANACYLLNQVVFPRALWGQCAETLDGLRILILWNARRKISMIKNYKNHTFTDNITGSKNTNIMFQVTSQWSHMHSPLLLISVYRETETSLLNMRNKSGPRAEPWGTPIATDSMLDFRLFACKTCTRSWWN